MKNAIMKEADEIICNHVNDIYTCKVFKDNKVVDTIDRVNMINTDMVKTSNYGFGMSIERSFADSLQYGYDPMRRVLNVHKS